MTSVIDNIARFIPWGSTPRDAAFHHEMHDHVFAPGSCGPARLYYQGDVPILEIQSDNPYEAGEAHGYLLALSLQRLLEKLFPARPISELSRENSGIIEKFNIRIPFACLQEMQGIAEGFNRRVKETGNIITLHDLIFFHMISAAKLFVAEELEDIFDKDPDCEDRSVASTVVVDRDKEKGITFGRTFDWGWFGGIRLGEMSLVINRKYSALDKASTVEIGWPGLVGTVTGMNDSGLCLAMHGFRGKTGKIQGMPATFFNRLCLETARAVDDVAHMLKNKNPLDCYHLTIADKDSARSFHLYQRPKGDYVEKSLTDGVPLITTYFRDPSQTRTTSWFGKSRTGSRVVTELFNRILKPQPKKSIADIVNESLANRPVNNEDTIHKVVMFPASRQLFLAFDSQYAGRIPLHAVDTTELFTRPMAIAPSEAAPTAASADSRKREAVPVEDADLPARKRVCSDHSGTKEDPMELP